MKRFLILLTLLALSLSGCGRTNEHFPKAPVKDDNSLLVGTWFAQIDLSKIIRTQLSHLFGCDKSELEEIAFQPTWSITFRADGTCSFCWDIEKTNAACELFLAKAIPLYTQILYRQSEENGVERQAFSDSYMSEHGCSVEAYAHRTMSSYIDGYRQESSFQVGVGTYMSVNGSLYISTGAEDTLERTSPQTYIIDGDIMYWEQPLVFIILGTDTLTFVRQ